MTQVCDRDKDEYGGQAREEGGVPAPAQAYIEHRH